MTTLFKNFLLIDGSGQPPQKADVLVKNERVAAVGIFPNYQARQTFDGMGGAYLAPGFIDINTASDRYLTLFNNPAQKSFLLQGVTTIIGGQNGISLAPLFEGSLNLKNLWVDTRKTNINWQSFAQYLEEMSKKKLGVNYGSLVGHTTVREAIAGDDFRDLTPKELEVMNLTLTRALREGAFGISADLTFPLTALTPFRELKMIAEAAAAHKTLMALKIRDNRENTADAAAEAVNLAKETGVKIILNNFSVPNGFEKEYARALELITENAASADAYFTLHPFNVSVLPLFSLLPAWARRGGFAEIRENFKNPAARAKIKNDLPRLKPEDVIIFHAPGHQYLNGQTLKSFSQNRGLNLKDGLVALMDLLDLRGSVVYRDVSVKKLAAALAHEKALVSSGSSSFDETRFDFIPEHSQSAFNRYLEIIFSKKKPLALETALRKITAEPARLLGLKDRGLVAENYFADLTTIRNGKIENVFVNGRHAVKDGACADVSAGKVLKKEQGCG